jgi:hypothetical protein
MRDDWKRIIELERRQRKNAYQLNSLERTVKAAKEKLKLADQAVPTIISGGGGGGSNIIRWAKDFCMAVVFDTYPTIDAAYSENPTKDADSLEAAIHALETGLFLPSEIQTSSDPEYYELTGYQSVYYEDESKLWQFMAINGEYRTNVVTEIASEHLSRVGMHFQCGWFPDASASLTTDQPDPDDVLDVTKKYVPGANPERAFYTTGSYDSVTDLPSWDALYGSLRNAELGAINLQSIGRQFTTDFAPFNIFYRIAKWVSFWIYDDEGMRRSLAYLACHHDPYDGDALVTPFAFSTGPKRDTVGSYLLPGIVNAYISGIAGVTPPNANDFFDNLNGSELPAELFVSWGSTCEDAEPPIGGEDPEDWEDFCAAITAASATFVKIPGLTIKFNGTEIYLDTLGTYLEQPTITFEFAPRLKDYLDANPDVSITYDFEAICGHVPAQAIYDAGEVTDGFSIIFPRNTNCDSRPIETENHLTVKMEASPSRYLFQDECCTPYASHCSVSSLTSYQIIWYLDPP